MKDVTWYTEQAISLLGGNAPSLVWLPPDIRKRKQRLTADGVVTGQDFTNEEINRRVLAADPLGFLIAIMNGQPVPKFRLQRPVTTSHVVGMQDAEDGEHAAKRPRRAAPPHALRKINEDASAKLDTVNGVDVFVDYETATLANRERVAMYLMENFAPIKSSRTRMKKAISDQDAKFESVMDRRAREAGYEGETNE